MVCKRDAKIVDVSLVLIEGHRLAFCNQPCCKAKALELPLEFPKAPSKLSLNPLPRSGLTDQAGWRLCRADP